MVTITLRDEDAVEMLSILTMRLIFHDPNNEKVKRAKEEFKHALLLCDCGASSNIGRAEQDADEHPPQGIADHE